MNRYDSYKDSGVEWIGEIPSTWEKRKFKWDIFYQEGPGLRTFQFTESGVRVICVSNITEHGIDFETTHTRHISQKEYEEKYKHFTVKNRDILLSSSGSIGKVSRYFFDGEPVILNTSTIRIHSSNENYYLDDFVPYVLSSNYIQIQLRFLMTGGIVSNFGPSHLDQLFNYIPTLSEQNQIVSFLDTKTSLIDSLIEKTKRKIELLKEKRTSLINEVVTKGLNTNVEMKDSGVEWIGKIPSHYQFGKLKHLCKENQRSLPNSVDPYYELNYIEISDVNSEGVIGNRTPYVFSESPSRCRRIVQKGDVIVSTVRTYLKSIGLIEEEVEDLICSTGFSVLTPNNEINSKYLFYLLRTEWFISMVISKSEGVSYPSIQSEKLMNIDVVYCELSEQQQIVSYLDEHTQLIDKTISVEKRRIDTLKEYRQSLISEVVTGKLDVRLN